jgi:purine-binding chemotaxis protein CheW
MTARDVVVERAATLRREFDAQFASPPRESPETVDFLLVQIGGRPYAMRLAELGGIAKAGIVARAPTRRPELLGLAGIRGRVVGVYALATLLGGADEHRPAAWLALSAGSEPVALAFERLDAFVRVPRSSVHDEAGPDAPGPFVRGVLETEGALRPVLDIARMFAAVRRSTDAAGSPRRNP